MKGLSSNNRSLIILAVFIAGVIAVFVYSRILAANVRKNALEVASQQGFVVQAIEREQRYVGRGMQSHAQVGPFIYENYFPIYRLQLIKGTNTFTAWAQGKHIGTITMFLEVSPGKYTQLK